MAYDQHYALAQFFSDDPDDKWLSDHFYFNCMNVAIKIKDDGGWLRAEASINAGKVFESLGRHSAFTLLIGQQECHPAIINVRKKNN